MSKNNLLKTVIIPVVFVGLLVAGYFFIQNKKVKEQESKKEQEQEQENKQESSKPTIGPINIIEDQVGGEVVPTEKQPQLFLRYDITNQENGGNIFKINYDGTRVEKISNDKVYNMVVSPLFDNVLYTSLYELNSDLKRKYLTINLGQFPDFKNIKKIAEYSLDEDLMNNNISRFTTELKWSNNGKILSYLVRLKQNLSEGDVLFYIDSDKANKEGSFINNPFKDELSHYFDKIRRYTISPSGKFIALTIEERQDRGLILYNLAKEDNVLILTDIFSDDFFFDAKDNFYYSIPGKYKTDQKWTKRNAETEISDIFYNKPIFWDKFLNAVFSSKLDKVAYICEDYYSNKICIASSEGQNEKFFFVDNINISNIQDLFWGKDENYLFFTASFKDKNDELPSLSLWILNIVEGNIKKLNDLEVYN